MFINVSVLFFIIQVHIEFKKQCLELSVDKLLEQFVLTKYTGLEKPGKYKYFSFCIA